MIDFLLKWVYTPFSLTIGLTFWAWVMSGEFVDYWYWKDLKEKIRSGRH